MKKTLSLVLTLALALCLCTAAFAAGTHTVTIINGMDGSVAETFTVKDGEDFVFSISCAAPADMGPVASGELGSGVTTTVGKITYSNITTGGPNAYPTAETVTISGITKDATVTVTPNPDEVGSQFPTITEGELAGGASGEASGASGEASGDASGESMSVEDAFVEYIHEWLIAENEINSNMTIEVVEDEFMPLVREFDFVSFPAEMLYNGMLEQGCPMTFEEFAAQYVPAGGAAGSDEEAFIEYIHEWLLAELAVNSNMTIEQLEDEFMPLVREMDFVTFPAEMIYSGMLEQGVPMTFDEFVAAK